MEITSTRLALDMVQSLMATLFWVDDKTRELAIASYPADPTLALAATGILTCYGATLEDRLSVYMASLEALTVAFFQSSLSTGRVGENVAEIVLLHVADCAREEQLLCLGGRAPQGLACQLNVAFSVETLMKHMAPRLCDRIAAGIPERVLRAKMNFTSFVAFEGGVGEVERLGTEYLQWCLGRNVAIALRSNMPGVDFAIPIVLPPAMDGETARTRTEEEACADGNDSSDNEMESGGELSLLLVQVKNWGQNVSRRQVLETMEKFVFDGADEEGKANVKAHRCGALERLFERLNLNISSSTTRSSATSSHRRGDGDGRVSGKRGRRRCDAMSSGCGSGPADPTSPRHGRNVGRSPVPVPAFLVILDLNQCSSDVPTLSREGPVLLSEYEDGGEGGNIWGAVVRWTDMIADTGSAPYSTHNRPRGIAPCVAFALLRLQYMAIRSSVLTALRAQFAGEPVLSTTKLSAVVDDDDERSFILSRVPGQLVQTEMSSSTCKDLLRFRTPEDIVRRMLEGKLRESLSKQRILQMLDTAVSYPTAIRAHFAERGKEGPA
jgi:hypothetical protein